MITALVLITASANLVIDDEGLATFGTDKTDELVGLLFPGFLDNGIL